MRQTS